jgi:uncharacterized membrane protein YfcA
MSPMLEGVAALVAVVAGAIAAVAGFGIGSLLTPVLALALDTKTAVAAVSVPHLVATSLRLWRLRGEVDREVLLGFGVASAVGGLAGALLHARAESLSLRLTFGALLLLAAASELTGLMRRVRLGRPAAAAAGAVSGAFGGLVGNQGGIRTAALLGFRVPPVAFVATATAVALIVDLVRMPVYLVVEGDALRELVRPIGLMCAGAIVGTLAGERLLRRVPERHFRRMVAMLLAALGTWMLVGAR